MLNKYLKHNNHKSNLTVTISYLNYLLKIKLLNKISNGKMEPKHIVQQLEVLIILIIVHKFRK